MISIHIDDTLKKFEREIRYSFDFLFHTLGYTHRFLDDTSIAGNRDVLILYWPGQPDQEELRNLAKYSITIFIPAEPALFDLGYLSSDQIRRQMREIKLRTKTPILSEGKPAEIPIEIYSETDLYGGRFNFDLVGNLFFHLSGYEEFSSRKTDPVTGFPESSSAFNEYRDYPFVHNFMWAMDRLIKDQITKKGITIAQKEYWPNGESFGASITHTVDRVQKWNLNSLVYSVFEDFRLFFSLRWKPLFGNFISKMKYIFTNYEMYWNFEEFRAMDESYQCKTTYFLSPRKHRDVDYSTAEDPAIQEELNAIISAGHEVALLAPGVKLEPPQLRDYRDTLQNLTGNQNFGIRHSRFLFQPRLLEMQQKMVWLYDSSFSFIEHIGFKRGFSFPFQPYVNGVRMSHWELPVSMNDECLKLTKYTRVPLEKAKTLLKRVIENIQKANGYTSFDFTISNYEEIKYIDKLYPYLLELLKTKSVYLAPMRDIATWWEHRKYVTVEEGEFEISIFFTYEMRNFTLKLHGERKIAGVSGVENEVEDQVIHFRNIRPNSIAIIEYVQEHTEDYGA